MTLIINVPNSSFVFSGSVIRDQESDHHLSRFVTLDQHAVSIPITITRYASTKEKDNRSNNNHDTSKRRTSQPMKIVGAGEITNYANCSDNFDNGEVPVFGSRNRWEAPLLNHGSFDQEGPLDVFIKRQQINISRDKNIGSRESGGCKYENNLTTLAQNNSSRSISPKKHPSNWSKCRQSSFSSYLSESRKELENENKEVEETLPNLISGPSFDRNFELQKTASGPELCREKIKDNRECSIRNQALSTQITTKKRHRKETIQNIEHFPNSQIEELKHYSCDPEISLSIEIVNKTNNCNDPSVLIQSSSFVHDRTVLQNINNNVNKKTSKSSASKPTHFSQTAEFVPLIQKSKSHIHCNEIIDKNINKSDQSKCSSEYEFTSYQPSNNLENSTKSTIRTSHSFENNYQFTKALDEKFSLPTFPDSKKKVTEKTVTFSSVVETESHFSIPAINSGFSIEQKSKTNADSRNSNYGKRFSIPSTEVSDLRPHQDGLENIYNTSKNTENEIYPRNRSPLIDVKNSSPLNKRSLPTNALADIEKSSTSPEKIAKSNSINQLPKKLSKSQSATAAFRYLTRGITLPPISSRTGTIYKTDSQSSPEEVTCLSRLEFFNELSHPLSEELSEYLYKKMKGIHDGLLVSTCRLAEEDKVMQLIKELRTSGQLQAPMINQCDKTGRVSICIEIYYFILHAVRIS